MKLEQLRPPGSWCQDYSFFDLAKPKPGQIFLEVGCGTGQLTYNLLKMGLTGVAIEPSEEAFNIARPKLNAFLNNNHLKLFHEDFLNVVNSIENADLVVCVMVLEHIHDDIGFLKALYGKVKPGGKLLVTVPAQMKHWGFEDEVVGHVRRYEHEDFLKIFAALNVTSGHVYSIGVPTMNFLKSVSDYLIKRQHQHRLTIDKSIQTQTSGTLETKFKNNFPGIFRLILNPIVMWPFCVVQRLFYKSKFGIAITAVMPK